MQVMCCEGGGEGSLPGLPVTLYRKCTHVPRCRDGDYDQNVTCEIRLRITLIHCTHYLYIAESQVCAVTFSDLLGFWTGSRSVPPGGFKDPSKLRIDFFAAEPGIKRLPSASTCGLVLQLPRGVEDVEEFEETMTFVVQDTEGFGRV